MSEDDTEHPKHQGMLFDRDAEGGDEVWVQMGSTHGQCEPPEHTVTHSYAKVRVIDTREVTESYTDPYGESRRKPRPLGRG